MNDPAASIELVRRHHRLDRWRPLPIPRLLPEQRVRDLCAANLCGNWDRHPMCPPRVGTLPEASALFAGFQAGLLVQTTFSIDPRIREASRETQRVFAEALLALEATLAAAGAVEPLALVGGPCALCDPCHALDGAPCPAPERARPSLEALGVDVMALIEAAGWDGAFYDDRLSWTGAVLFR